MTNADAPADAEPNQPTRSGGCLCGAVRYTVLGVAKSVEHCHCSMCRRAHGALYASGALIDRAQLRLERGGTELLGYESSPGNWRRFCGTCGSQLFVEIDHIPGEVYYWATTLDDGVHPGHAGSSETHIFLGSRAPWERLPEDICGHETIPEGVGPGRSGSR